MSRLNLHDNSGLHRGPTRRNRYYVAVTGHQNLGDARTATFVRSRVGELLATLRDARPEGLVALSGLAAGADTIFAEAALRGGIPLHVALAAADIVENFTPGPERERFLTLCALSHHVSRLPFASRSSEAYLALGRWLVNSCNLLVAVWNGLPAAGLGGTGDVVAYALERGRRVIHIHTLEHRVAELS